MRSAFRSRANQEEYRLVRWPDQLSTNFMEEVGVVEVVMAVVTREDGVEVVVEVVDTLDPTKLNSKWNKMERRKVVDSKMPRWVLWPSAALVWRHVKDVLTEHGLASRRCGTRLMRNLGLRSILKDQQEQVG